MHLRGQMAFNNISNSENPLIIPAIISKEILEKSLANKKYTILVPTLNYDQEDQMMIEYISAHNIRSHLKIRNPYRFKLLTILDKLNSFLFPSAHSQSCCGVIARLSLKSINRAFIWTFSPLFDKRATDSFDYREIQKYLSRYSKWMDLSHNRLN